MRTNTQELPVDEVVTEARQKTVLVVDDEAPIRELISVMLELEGHRVLQAEDGHRALEIAAQEDLDLVTLDVMMPGLDGWDVAAAMDADPRLSAVPRLMVSGMAMEQLKAAPGATRASAVLAKPFDFTEFTEIVAMLLAKPVAVPGPRPSTHDA